MNIKFLLYCTVVKFFFEKMEQFFLQKSLIISISNKALKKFCILSVFLKTNIHCFTNFDSGFQDQYFDTDVYIFRLK